MSEHPAQPGPTNAPQCPQVLPDKQPANQGGTMSAGKGAEESSPRGASRPPSKGGEPGAPTSEGSRPFLHVFLFPHRLFCKTPSCSGSYASIVLPLPGCREEGHVQGAGVSEKLILTRVAMKIQLYPALAVCQALFCGMRVRKPGCTCRGGQANR